MLVLLLLNWTVIAPLVSYFNCGDRIRNASGQQLQPKLSALVGPLFDICIQH
jgi:hypothetical protein